MRAFGALRFEPPGNLLRDLAAVAAARPAQLSPYNVGSLAWGCARLGVHPGDAVMQVAPNPKLLFGAVLIPCRSSCMGLPAAALLHLLKYCIYGNSIGCLEF